MNRQYMENIIEQQVSKFSNIKFELNEYTILFTNRDEKNITLININKRKIREEYILDVETFEVLDQVE